MICCKFILQEKSQKTNKQQSPKHPILSAQSRRWHGLWALSLCRKGSCRGGFSGPAVLLERCFAIGDGDPCCNTSCSSQQVFIPKSTVVLHPFKQPGGKLIPNADPRDFSDVSMRSFSKAFESLQARVMHVSGQLPVLRVLAEEEQWIAGCRWEVLWSGYKTSVEQRAAGVYGVEALWETSVENRGQVETMLQGYKTAGISSIAGNLVLRGGYCSLLEQHHSCEGVRWAGARQDGADRGWAVGKPSWRPMSCESSRETLRACGCQDCGQRVDRLRGASCFSLSHGVYSSVPRAVCVFSMHSPLTAVSHCLPGLLTLAYGAYVLRIANISLSSMKLQ